MTMMKTRIVEIKARPSVVHCNPLFLTCLDGSNAGFNVDATVLSSFDSLGRAVTFEVLVSLDEVPDDVLVESTLSGVVMEDSYISLVTAVKFKEPLDEVLGAVMLSGVKVVTFTADEVETNDLFGSSIGVVTFNAFIVTLDALTILLLVEFDVFDVVDVETSFPV
jgi:hypothetical protein